MSQPKVSVIVAVYNVENYLVQCLDSVVNQTLKDIEIICMDDCSTDSSLEILKEYRKKDSRIKLLEFGENVGQGKTRNVALDIAKGEYIMFLDGDDWLELTACEKAYEHIKANNNDFAYFNMFDYFENKDVKHVNTRRLRHFTNFSSSQNIRLYEYDDWFITTGEPWYKIYKRDFLNNNNIRFSNLRICEDVPFYIKVIVCAETVSVLNLPLYNYRIRDNSCGTTCVYNWKDLFSARKESYNYIIKSSHSEKFLKVFLPYCINTLLYWYDRFSRIDSSISKDFYIELRKYFMEFDNEYNIEEFRKKINYPKFKRILKYNWSTKCFMDFIHLIFSITNTKKHKVITFFGIKLKIKRFSMNKQYKNLCKKYKKTIKRLQQESKNRKIRVAFYVNDTRWKCQNLYDLMSKDDHYEPFIIVGKHSTGPHKYEQQSESELKQIYEDYKSKGMNVELAYHDENGDVPLSEFHPDVIFYSRPWGISAMHSISNSAEFALTCYVPYFISNSPASVEAGSLFQNILWRYYVINEDLKNEYKKVMKNKGKNLRAVGYPFLEDYKKQDDTEKKYVIYAPHWTVGKNFIKYATFEWNGEYILNFAKQHPELNWVFKPHPILKGTLVDTGIMTKEETDAYWAEWDKIGIKYEGADYLPLFKASKALITDCGSFLAEYMPTKNPVILLRSDIATPYNFLAQKVTKYYYKAHNLEELSDLFNEVLLKGNDINKKQRLQMLEDLHLVNSASENILRDLDKTLCIERI